MSGSCLVCREVLGEVDLPSGLLWQDAEVIAANPDLTRLGEVGGNARATPRETYSSTSDRKISTRARAADRTRAADRARAADRLRRPHPSRAAGPHRPAQQPGAR